MLVTLVCSPAVLIRCVIETFPYRGNGEWVNTHWLRYHLQADHGLSKDEACELIALCIKQEYVDVKRTLGWHDRETSSVITELRPNHRGLAFALHAHNAERFQAASLV